MKGNHTPPSKIINSKFNNYHKNKKSQIAIVIATGSIFTV